MHPQVKQQTNASSIGEDVLPAGWPAFTPSRWHNMQPSQTLAVLRGSSAGVASAENRRPAGEKLDSRGVGQRLRLCGRRGDRGPRSMAFRERPVQRYSLHSARAGPREAALLDARGGNTSNRCVTGDWPQTVNALPGLLVCFSEYMQNSSNNLFSGRVCNFILFYYVQLKVWLCFLITS